MMVACRGRRSAEVARLTLIDGSRDGGFCAKPGEPSEVVGEIGETDLRRGSDLADGSDDEGKAAFLRGEDVLDARAHSGSRRIAASDVRRHRLASGLGR